MLGVEGLLVDGKGALEQRLGLGVAALAVIEPGEVAEVAGDRGVIGAESLLVDGKGALNSGSASA